jgi:hypothetical protein
MHAIWTPPRWALLALMTMLFFAMVLASAPAVDFGSLDLGFGGGADTVAPSPEPVVSDGFDLRDPIASPIESPTWPSSQRMR